MEQNIVKLNELIKVWNELIKILNEMIKQYWKIKDLNVKIRLK